MEDVFIKEEEMIDMEEIRKEIPERWKENLQKIKLTNY